MIIIYRGIGVIVIVFGVAALVAGGWLQTTYHLNEHLHVAAMTAIFAALCIICGQLDDGKSTLFFIPVAYWGYLAIIIPAAGYGVHVYEKKLDIAAVKAELTEFIRQRPGTTPAPANTAAAAAAAMASAAERTSPIGAASASPANPVPAVADNSQTPPAAPDTPGGSANNASPDAAPRVPTFSWSPQSTYDAIAKVDKKWLLGNTLLTDGTAVQAKMEADDYGIKVTITVDADADKRKAFVYEPDSADASFALTTFRVKIDDAEPHQSRSYMPSANVTENEIFVNFWDFDVLKKAILGQDTNVNFGETRAGQGVGSIFGAVMKAQLMQKYNLAAASADGTLSQLAQAGSVIVELPLADGSDNFVDINPRDPYVLSFVQEREQQLGTAAPAAPVNPPANPAPDNQANNPAAPDWCPRAKKPAEILICENPQLEADENRMEDLYHARIASAGLTPDLKTLVRNWIGSRDGCAATANDVAAIPCIHASYTRLIGQLEQLAP